MNDRRVEPDQPADGGGTGNREIGHDPGSRSSPDSSSPRPGPGSSLVSRFAASTAVLAAVLVLAAILFFVLLHVDFFRGVVDTSLRGFSLALAERVWAEPELAPAIARNHRVGMVVESPTERFAFTPEGEAIDPEAQLRASRRYRRIDAVGPEGRRIVFFWDMVTFARAHLPLLAALIVLLLLLIGATYAFQLSQLRPLRWLRSGVEAVSRGDFATRVPVVRADEIGQVARAFNDMARRVERMMSDRERLLADVSHELRSPLARIKVALELLPPGEKRESIARDLREMETLTVALLERERVRTRIDRLELDRVDLAALCAEVVSAWGDGGPGVELSPLSGSMLGSMAGSRLGPVEVRADADLLRILIHNLVENGVKFSLPDSRPVRVSLLSEPAGVELRVDDDGRGIPAEESERVFEPFVKLDPARGHRSGYGLGLNLCRRIAEAHGGTIEIESRGERGVRVRVRLPRG